MTDAGTSVFGNPFFRLCFLISIYGIVSNLSSDAFNIGSDISNPRNDTEDGGGIKDAIASPLEHPKSMTRDLSTMYCFDNAVQASLMI